MVVLGQHNLEQKLTVMALVWACMGSHEGIPKFDDCLGKQKLIPEKRQIISLLQLVKPHGCPQELSLTRKRL